MGQIVATMKVFPEDVSINLDELKKRIKSSMPEYASIYRIDEEPIAFGLVVLILQIVMSDSGGIIDKVEESMDYYLGHERKFVEEDIYEILKDYDIP